MEDIVDEVLRHFNMIQYDTIALYFISLISKESL